jgi:hypothetical protein
MGTWAELHVLRFCLVCGVSEWVGLRRTISQAIGILTVGERTRDLVYLFAVAQLLEPTAQYCKTGANPKAGRTRQEHMRVSRTKSQRRHVLHPSAPFSPRPPARRGPPARPPTRSPARPPGPARSLPLARSPARRGPPPRPLARPSVRPSDRLPARPPARPPARSWQKMPKKGLAV